MVIPSDRPGNFLRVEHALEQASAAGASIACFPEACILGWTNPAAHWLACPIPGDDTARVGNLARAHGLYIAIGLSEKDGDRLYDSAVLMGPDGTLLMKHRKRNILTELMTPPYTPGDAVTVADTALGRVGMLICADTFVPEYLEEMAALEPQLVVVPYGWAETVEAWPEHGNKLANTVSAAARAIGAPVVGVDCVGIIVAGPWQGRVFGGQSVAADAQGRIRLRCRDRDTDVGIVDIPLPC